MVLSNPFPGHTALATFADLRRDLEGLVVRNAAGVMRAGVFPDHLNPLVTGRSDMKVNIGDFRAVQNRGGAVLLANVGVDTSVTLPAAPAANKRIDLIYVTMRSTALADAASTPVFGFVQGTASATPVAPSLPANLSTAIPLATVEIPAGATTTLSSGVVITQVYPYTALAGGTAPVRNSVELAAWVPAPGGTAYQIDTGATMVRDGSGWVAASGRTVRAEKSVVVSGAGEKILNSVSSVTPVAAGTLVRMRALGIGLYTGGATSGVTNWRHTVGGAAVTVTSPLVPGSAMRRVGGISGNVTTHDLETSFIMPSTGILTVGLTFDQNAYSDTWILEMSV